MSGKNPFLGFGFVSPFITFIRASISKMGASLDLNFTENLSLIDDISGTNLITFSRASSGTYVGSDGLIKNSPVNLVTYSNDLTAANWTYNRLTAPTGATTEINSPVSGSVFKILETADTGEHSFYKTAALNISSSVTITTSLYINTSIGRSKVRVYHFAQNNLTFIWDLVNNTQIDLTGGTSASINSASVGDGWYRLEWTDVTTASNNVKPVVMTVNDSDQFNFAGDTSKGFYVAGYQVEEGTLTDYIPTTSTIGGAPRFDHDPVTLQSLGLLIEESRTNLLTYSEEFDQWGKSNAAVTPNSAVSPDGTAAADKIVWTNAATNGGSVFRISTDRGTATNPIVRYTLTGTGTATVLSTLATGSNYDIDPVGNGWYRCWLYDSTAGQTLSVYSKAGEFDRLELQFYISNRYIYVRDSVATQGDGTSGVYVWGAQLEVGSFPTSYIPTTASTVTRLPDIATIEGTNFSSWYNQSEGTVYSEFDWNLNNQSNYTFPWYIQYDNGNGVYLGNWGSTTRQSLGVRFNNPGMTSQLNIPGSTPGVSHKYATTLNAFDFAVALDGGFTGTYTGSDLATSMTSLDIGGLGGSYQLNGHISRLTYFPTRKSDEDLVSLTLPTVITYGITSPGGVFNLRSAGTVDYEVDWELTGSREASTENVLPHTYTAGNHTLAVYSDSAYRPYFNLVAADASQITSVVIGSGANLGTNLTDAWEGAVNMTSFVCPFSVTSTVTSFYAAWSGCALTNFPLIDTALGTTFYAAWYNNSSLTSFELIDTSSGTSFSIAWYGCSSLADFPANMFDTTGTLIATAFNNTWTNCALTAQSIENILVSLDTNGATGITLGIGGVNNAARYQGTSGTTLNWSAAAEQSFNNLETKGWTISYKSYA